MAADERVPRRIRPVRPRALLVATAVVMLAAMFVTAGCGGDESANPTSESEQTPAGPRGGGDRDRGEDDGLTAGDSGDGRGDDSPNGGSARAAARGNDSDAAPNDTPPPRDAPGDGEVKVDPPDDPPPEPEPSVPLEDPTKDDPPPPPPKDDPPKDDPPPDDPPRDDAPRQDAIPDE